MKILKILVLSLALSAALVIPVTAPAAVIYSETPAKTVVIKHPMANDANKFFSSGTVFNFEVYKAGSKEDLTKTLASLRSNAAVENVSLGPLVGDYQGFTLVLKSVKDKAWFMSEFKKAGLGYIKLNNNPVVEVDKL